jgi:alpha-ribazole phosphatase
MILWTVRHAPVLKHGICYGQSDVETTLGPDLAAARVMAQLGPIAEVVTSPWERTRPIAERIARARGVELKIDPRVSEIAFGAWEGRPYAELEREPEFVRWSKSWRTESAPGGETLSQLLARVAEFVRGATPGALVVTHAGVVRALRCACRLERFDEALREPVEPLKVERLEVPPELTNAPE